MVAALGTSAGEQQLITGNGSAGCRVLQYGGRKYHMVQIYHLSAGGADKMCVWLRGVIVAFQPVDNADGLDHILLFKHGNVAVDRTQTQIGKAGLQLPVDPFGGGMALGASDAL